MSLLATLTTIRRLYFDTAPLIYYTEGHSEYLPTLHVIMSQIAPDRIHAITSVLTLTETLMKPLQQQQMTLFQQYRTLFYHTAALTTVPITAPIAELAATLRAQYRLRTPDALQIATAIDAGCDAFLTNDIALQRVTEIAVLVVADLATRAP
ncbi:type II toxin-antitoxin system VapC family toxin [Herpetosiphon llansteffanensis]|uniref:type II toxin-antitoxin system VapC family toxin n=1 Tax=Herpetosiphon llansteffanensis TaxID=2094568 RepID=UPI000D7C8A5D|nr:PIN domain-containing protein [Herpetosiphon llansteffanensis]